MDGAGVYWCCFYWRYLGAGTTLNYQMLTAVGRLVDGSVGEWADGCVGKDPAALVRRKLS
jgi:hypothetical protein